jgi:hypothetical protein
MGDAPPFLLLKLRTCDEFDTWLQPVPDKVPLLLDLTLDYSADMAALKPWTRIDVTVSGYKRTFALLSIEPAQQRSDVYVFKPLARPTPEVQGPSWSSELEFDTSPQLAHDIERLADFLERRETTQNLAVRATGTPN